MIIIIAKREFRNLINSPLAWAILAMMQLVQGLIFYRLLQTYQLNPIQAEDAHTVTLGVTYHVVALFLGSICYAAMLTIPILTMSQISGEWRQKTWPLLAAAPVSYIQIIIGKFLGLQFFLWLLTGVLCLMPLSLLTGVTLDTGILLSASIGVLLTLGVYSAMGILMSTLTKNPAIAAFSTMAILLVLWVTEMLSVTGFKDLDSAIAYLSIFQHLSSLLRGLIDTRDIVYFIIFIVGSLALASLRLHSRRA